MCLQDALLHISISRATGVMWLKVGAYVSPGYFMLRYVIVSVVLSQLSKIVERKSTRESLQASTQISARPSVSRNPTLVVLKRVSTK
jgi:hypothetical protein